MSSSHASKGGRRWRYYVSRAALTGRKQDAGSIVRVPASEIENRITRAVGTHLAVQAAIAIDDHPINHSVLGANQAIPQHEQTRRLRRDPPTEDDVRNAIERATVSAKRIEIVLSESIVAEAGPGIDTPLDFGRLRVAAARLSSAWAKRSNPYKQCERSARRFHQSIARRSPLARRTPGRSPRPSCRSPSVASARRRKSGTCARGRRSSPATPPAWDFPSPSSLRTSSRRQSTAPFHAASAFRA